MKKLRLRRVQKLAWDLNSADRGFELRFPSLQCVFMIFPKSHPKRRVQHKLHTGHRFICPSNIFCAYCVSCYILDTGDKISLLLKHRNSNLTFVTWCPVILNVPCIIILLSKWNSYREPARALSNQVEVIKDSRKN